MRVVVLTSTRYDCADPRCVGLFAGVVSPAAGVSGRDFCLAGSGIRLRSSFVWIAVGSPLGELDEELLSVHMVQHPLLMTVAPPLLLLGPPAPPLLHGLRQIFSQIVLGPFLRWGVAQRLGRVMTHPVFCWLAATTTLLGWHHPAAFALGLESHSWHEVEHASFLAAGLLSCVVRNTAGMRRAIRISASGSSVCKIVGVSELWESPICCATAPIRTGSQRLTVPTSLSEQYFFSGGGDNCA